MKIIARSLLNHMMDDGDGNVNGEETEEAQGVQDGGVPNLDLADSVQLSF